MHHGIKGLAVIHTAARLGGGWLSGWVVGWGVGGIEAEAAALHHEAHESCFIANSVKTAVTVLPAAT